MLRLLLGMGAGLRPNPRLKVQLLPTHRQNLTLAGASQQEQPDDIGSLSVLMAGERAAEGSDLGGGEVALALFLMIALHALAWVVRAPAPADRLGEHLGQNSD